MSLRLSSFDRKSADSRCSGKSNSVTITNEKGRLSPEEIERMVKEAEEFAAEDEAQRKRIEALNSLSSFVFGLKTQLGEQDAFGGKLSEDDREELLAVIKETTDWIDDYGQTTSAEDLEEKLQGTSACHMTMPMKLMLTCCLQRCRRR